MLLLDFVRTAYFLLTLAAWLTSAAASRSAIPTQDPPPYFVSLHIAPVPSCPGFDGAIPALMVEWFPKTPEEADGLKDDLKDVLLKYEWDFSQGFGTLVSQEGGSPCRIYALVLDPVKSQTVLSAVRAVDPRLARDGAFNGAMFRLCLAVVGNQASDLSDQFAVPFSQAAVRQIASYTVLALIPAYPPVTASSTWKVEGAAACLLRALADAGIVAGAGKKLEALTQYKDQVQEVKDYLGGLINPEAYPRFLCYQFGDILKTRNEAMTMELALDELNSVRSAKITFPKPTTIPDPNAPIPSPAPAPANQPLIRIGIHQAVHEDGIGPECGIARPNTVPGAAGGSVKTVDALVSLVSTTSYPRVELEVFHQVLKAWRWHAILRPPADDVAAQLRETMIRISEPLWEYISWKTANRVLDTTTRAGATERLDAIDQATVLARIAEWRARAADPAAATTLYHDRSAGLAGDGVYWDHSSVLNHQVNAAILTTMRANGQVEKEAVAAAILDLLAGGYTETCLPLPMRSYLQGLFPAMTPNDFPEEIERKSDLVWLREATAPLSAPAGSPAYQLEALARPFHTLGGSRVHLALNALVNTNQILAIRLPPAANWPGPSMFLTATGYDNVATNLRNILQKAEGASGDGLPERLELFEEGKHNQYSQTWLRDYRVALEKDPTRKDQLDAWFGDEQKIRETEAFVDYWRHRADLDDGLAQLKRVIDAQPANNPGVVSIKLGPHGYESVTDVGGPASVGLSVALNVVREAFRSVGTDAEIAKKEAVYQNMIRSNLSTEPGAMLERIWRAFLIGPGLGNAPQPSSVEQLLNLLKTYGRHVRAANGPPCLTVVRPGGEEAFQ